MRDFLGTKYCARVNQVVLAGKRGSRRHSTTSFNENVVSSDGNKLSNVKSLSFCDREGLYPLSLITITVLTFWIKKSTM